MIKNLKKNQILAPYTTFQIGGPADWFLVIRKEKEILPAIQWAKGEKIPFFLLGKGSNVLFSDQGFRGLVLKMENEGLEIESGKLLVESGTSLKKLVELCLKNSLSGLEFLAGIPGSIGGAVVGNAGAWQQNIGDKVERVKVITKDDQLEWLNHGECQFGYRQSRFKQMNEIILQVELRLNRGDGEEIKKRIKDNLEKRQIQPQEPSAGSIFINPKPDSAGDLIEKCGLKGHQIGGAQISPKHANFIINTGEAKAKDVLELITLAREKVHSKFGLVLKPEVLVLNENGKQIFN
ncbi:UDP-N-acetylmuramate dehydrogenase [Candidatus Shapirobacteria bacterium]|nr:UDP-N-acetylmuramate dehydrogenase [Candidatus Shapirobacteria bacterium]